MPRNGDGSSDNGPIEGQNIVHGAGDAPAQPEHAKNNIAPMPEIEKGAALEGLNASGGGNKADQAEPTVAGDAPKKD
ncbi:uncharacterized protein EKO05_0004680 [Ascochyta rabiei]|uniref:Uncharacterized protein n=1 Tax=Didymella rabiei TaxID=5454 RepID=A0A163KPJ0_DIDRA|nr:uncharacterized protein EKO05_0004680 [Ascochyta rabiei]KZM27151.1 hypothetical protein ST47_g1689 [Ascochyta rabiei]UPX14190.1 hypothetical protein EKO05_0004680 [Ascochyta rabiei]